MAVLTGFPGPSLRSVRGMTNHMIRILETLLYMVGKAIDADR